MKADAGRLEVESFWPEANPFASSTNLGGQSEWVMLSHAVLTTTEVLLSEAFNPPPTCSGGSALWSAVGGGLYAAATRCECTEQILVDKRFFVREKLSHIYFWKVYFFFLLHTRRTPSHSDFFLHRTFWIILHSYSDFPLTFLNRRGDSLSLLHSARFSNRFPSLWQFASSVAFCCSEFL